MTGPFAPLFPLAAILLSILAQCAIGLFGVAAVLVICWRRK